MKRELPVTCCTEWAALVTTEERNGRCCKTSGEQRCSGINAIAIKDLIGANVRSVKQPDITAIKYARTAKVLAIYSWV